jgi:hypothetical protein
MWGQQDYVEFLGDSKGKGVYALVASSWYERGAAPRCFGMALDGTPMTKRSWR